MTSTDDRQRSGSEANGSPQRGIAGQSSEGTDSAAAAERVPQPSEVVHIAPEREEVVGDTGPSEKLALDRLENAALLPSLLDPERAGGAGAGIETPQRLLQCAAPFPMQSRILRVLVRKQCAPDGTWSSAKTPVGPSADH